MMDHSTTMLTQEQAQQHPQAQPQHAASGQTILNTQPDNSSKRKQVKNACTNCQKACKKCDDDRPCSRCVKLGIADTCTSSVRKERKKGIKRGPYKRKEKQDEEDQGRKSRKSSNSDTGANPGEQQHPPLYGQVPAGGQPGPISYSYGFPPNLNQYHFMAYQYPYYGGDKAPQAGAYPINYPHPMYQYPMPMPGQHFPPPPAPGQVESQTATQPTDLKDAVKKKKSVKTTTDSESNKAKKPETNSKDQAKPQPMTPVPSSSSSSISSGTMSSPDSNQEDESTKHAQPTKVDLVPVKHEGPTTD